MEITVPALSAVCTHAALGRLVKIAGPLNKCLAAGEITTPLRAAGFLAQIAHESGEFAYSEEIWGPTPAQLRYEPPSKKATELGNTLPGDGKRFRGRGWIQITGRRNYAEAGVALGVWLEEHPELAADPIVAARVAAWFWLTRGLNALADAKDLEGMTRKINGGLNGLASRETYYKRALAALGA